MPWDEKATALALGDIVAALGEAELMNEVAENGRND
jgi:hypothetical protein